MNKINANFFTSPLFISIVVIVAVILIITFIFLYSFVIRRRRQYHIVKDLEKKYYTIHEKLTEDVEHYISRLNSISNQNTEYIQYYEKYHPEYMDTLQNNDRESFVAVTGLSKTIDEKKYRGIKNLIDSTKVVMANFEKKVDDLYDELSNLLSKDDEFHQNEIQLQRQLRSLKEKYTEHENELQIMANSFDMVFNKIEKLFKEFDDLSNGAHYEEANEKLPLIKKVLDALSESFDKYPALCGKISIIIPKRIDDVFTKFHELEEQDYPLLHLKINSRIEGYRTRLEEISKKLCAFKLNGVEEEIEDIDQSILEIFNQFTDEENAKAYYDEKCESVYNETFGIENQYKKINRSLPDYQKVYLIREKYLRKMEELSDFIDNIQNVKRDLDNYIHSNAKQPYTLITNKIKKMEKNMILANEIIDDYNTYLASLKVDSENDYKSICSYFVLLEDAEYRLREMAVPSYSDCLKEQFAIAYSMLNTIGNILSVQPINVDEANECLLKAKEHIDNLLKGIDEQVGQMEYAENSIVYANRYCQGFSECYETVKSAGVSFFEGDFTRSIDATISIVKRMNPEMGGSKK